MISSLIILLNSEIKIKLSSTFICSSSFFIKLKIERGERLLRIFPNNFIIEDDEDFVWGKSGTLKNNYNYSGYIITNKGKQYVFSIMINHFTQDLDKIKSAIVDFLIFLKTS